MKYPHDIKAQQDCVADIPSSIMKTIRETMTDSSNTTNERARFVSEASLTSQKAIELLIDHSNMDKRYNEDDIRFYIYKVSLNKDAEGYTRENCGDYTNKDKDMIFASNGYEDLLNALVRQVPNFKETYEANVKSRTKQQQEPQLDKINNIGDAMQSLARNT